MSRFEVIVATDAGAWPDHAEAVAREAAETVLAAMLPEGPQAAEVGVTLADNATVHDLNRRYRGQDKPTNVLSFPLSEGADDQSDPELPLLLGDVILAAETVTAEAAAQGKPFHHHLSHLVVHGVLHLLGCDHESDEDAEGMEALEVKLLAGLGIPDPYAPSSTTRPAST